MNDPNTQNIMIFAAGILAVVVLAGIFIGVSSVLWQRNQRRSAATPDAEFGHSLAAKQLHFAAATLTGLGLIFVLSMAMYLWGGEKGTAIFEACKTIIPPIITLILGYYFGKEPRPSVKSPPTN